MSGWARWLWVRCLMDQRLHLLDRQRVLDLAEVGCALARCGVLLLIPEVALHPVGQPCPTCVGGLLPSTVDEGERADDDGELPRRGEDQPSTGGDRAGVPAIPVVCGSHRLAPDSPPDVLTTRCGVVPPVTAVFSDHPHGSPVCPACAGAAEGDPIPGWPPVELLPALAPGGQPVPSPIRRRPMGPVPVPPPRFSHPAHRPDAGIPILVPGRAPGPDREPERAALRWGCWPADRLLHLLDPRAVLEATAVGCAQAHCGRLIFAANLMLRGDSVGMSVGCVAAGSAP